MSRGHRVRPCDVESQFPSRPLLNGVEVGLEVLADRGALWCGGLSVQGDRIHVREGVLVFLDRCSRSDPGSAASVGAAGSVCTTGEDEGCRPEACECRKSWTTANAHSVQVPHVSKGAYVMQATVQLIMRIDKRGSGRQTQSTLWSAS